MFLPKDQIFIILPTGKMKLRTIILWQKHILNHF